jgi:hypothetical protein
MCDYAGCEGDHDMSDVEAPVCEGHGMRMEWVTAIGRPGWICMRCLEGSGEDYPAPGEEGVGYTCDTARSEGW